MIFDLLDKLSEIFIKKEKFFENAVLLFLITITISTIIMLLICEVYMWPNGNDLEIGSPMHKYLSEGQASLWGILNMAFLIAKEQYLTWTGCYTSYFFSSLQPFIVLGKNFVVLNSVILIIGNVFGVLYFCKVILADICAINKKKVWICALGILTLNMQFVPSIYSAYLWFNGSFYNTIGFSAALIYIALEIKIVVQNKNNLHRYLCLIILSIFIGGTNYATSMLLIGFNLLLSLNIWTDKSINKKRLCIVAVQIMHFVCFALAVCAPGNSVRMQEFDQRNALVAILYSFVYALRHILDYMTIPVCCVVISLGIYIYLNIRKNGYKYRYPGVICLISFCFFAMMETPTSYAEGCMPPIRQVNIQIWTLYLLVIINIVYFIGWIDKEYICKLEWKQFSEITSSFPITKLKNDVLGIVFIIMLLICYRPDEITCAITAKSIFSLKEFAMECEERWALLEDDKIEVVAFKPFENLPDAFYGLKDVVVPESEVNMWINEAFEKYYNKKKVYLEHIED